MESGEEKSGSVIESSENEQTGDFIRHGLFSGTGDSAEHMNNENSQLNCNPSGDIGEQLTEKSNTLEALNDVHASSNSNIGPSNEREEISDSEFDTPAGTPPFTPLSPDTSFTDIHVNDGVSGASINNENRLTVSLTKDGTGDNSLQCSEDVIDLKSDRTSNVGLEKGDGADDLEAVSDDELAPDASHSLQNSHPTSNLEDLSSDEDDVGLYDDIDAQIIGSGAISHVSNSRLLKEVEPISDGEDIGQEDSQSTADHDAMEAGELPSPKAPTQPVKELLKEAEPISADETGDTDGELHSEDESKGLKGDLEAIDSEEEDMGGEGDSNSSQKKDRSSFSEEKTELNQVKADDDKTEHRYMDSISGEENSDLTSSDKKDIQNSPRCAEKDILKRSVSTNFNEHHEELDYEENEGDDVDPKLDVNPDENKDGDEEGELKEGEGDDKDEGELSDDDCEEGEIKEPGTRRPFIKPTCRFFQRGHCTWGISCRFLHPGVNDKGNYQMIEIPGFPPPGARPPPGPNGEWEEGEEEPAEIPPPPVPDIPHVETAWERGLRIAKEQRKKASERKEKETDFEEKRLNLKLEEDKDTNKENEQRVPKIVVKDPYYDQQAYDEAEYYKTNQSPWENNTHFENFEVRYNREHSFSPPYREKPPGPGPPPARYMPPPASPPIDKFGRNREDGPNYRPEPPINDYPSPAKRPDEWNDPWRRSKSPAHARRKRRSKSRGRRNRRSLSDSSNSSRSSSSSSSSRSSRSGSSSGSSRIWKRNISKILAPLQGRSRSPDRGPPGGDRHDRYGHSPPSRYHDQPRSQVVRGRGGYNHFDNNRGFRGGRFHRGRGGGFDRGGWRGRGGRGGHFNNYNNYNNYDDRNMRDPRMGRGGRDGPGRHRGRSPPDRPLPYARPRPKSVSSRSSSSRSRSRSRSRYSDSSRSRSRSRSRSSSNSSRSSSSSSSSAGSADSEHLYRDLGSPIKSKRGQAVGLKKKIASSKDPRSLKGAPPRGGPPPRGAPPKPSSSQKYPPMPEPPRPPLDLDRIPRPRDPPKSSQSSAPSKYASRNAPQPPAKAKDPLKTVGQKANIKLTLMPKQQQQQSGLGSRPNPLDSPPHKRRASERDSSPLSAPPAKRSNMSQSSQQAALRLASEKAAKLRQDKSPPLAAPPSSQRAKTAVSPQKPLKSRPSEPAVGKTAPKMVPAPAAGGAKVKKSMSSRREELLKQLKAVEDAIARKKTKIG